MKAIQSSLNILLTQIRRDNMNALFFILPVILALVLRFGIPALQELSVSKYDIAVNLPDYYSLIDLIMILITPFFFGFGASMVVLGEMDEHILPSYYVSPLGKKGYLISRLFIPVAVSLLVTVVLVLFLHLGTHGLILNLVLTLLSTLFCLVPFLLILSYSKNKVEGMVWAKFSMVLLLGIAIPYFITDWVQYLFGFWPSFWIAKLAITDNYLYVIPALLSSAIWIWILYGVFNKKMMR